MIVLCESVSFDSEGPRDEKRTRRIFFKDDNRQFDREGII